MGCFFHGCVKCQPFRDLKTLGEDTLADRYERTMARLELITNAGYTVKVMWECEFQESRLTEIKPHLLTHPLVTHSPLHTRDALYGGRTEAMGLHYKVEENRETIQYCDIMSLYPYICKYSKFPIGHPMIHVGDTSKNVDACLRMEGLIKCTVVPPKDLFHPVLPYRWNKKLLFCLCRSCVEEQNMRGQCQHFSDAERVISGTWVLDGLRVALTKGYKMMEIHEVYEYAVTQYDTISGEGGLFVEYINTFLKLKAEASGFPSWVRSLSVV